MPFKKKRKSKGKNQHYSIINKLRDKDLCDDEFETRINSLSLEELIALKLELASRAAGGFLYGLPIWKSSKDIIRDAVLKYALSATRTKKEASKFLGISVLHLNSALKKYETEKYFKD